MFQRFETVQTGTHVHGHEVDEALDRSSGRTWEPQANLPNGPDGVPRELGINVPGVLPELGDDRLGRVRVREKGQAAHLRVLHPRRFIVPGATDGFVRCTVGRVRLEDGGVQGTTVQGGWITVITHRHEKTKTKKSKSGVKNSPILSEGPWAEESNVNGLL